MGIKLTIDVESEDACAAGAPTETVLGALKKVSDRIKAARGSTSGRILDDNGNTIGSFNYEKT